MEVRTWPYPLNHQVAFRSRVNDPAERFLEVAWCAQNLSGSKSLLTSFAHGSESSTSWQTSCTFLRRWCARSNRRITPITQSYRPATRLEILSRSMTSSLWILGPFARPSSKAVNLYLLLTVWKT